MKSLTIDGVDKKVVRELEDALRFSVSKRPLIDFWVIFGDGISEVKERTLLAFLQSKVNEDFCFSEDDAKKFLSCMRRYSSKCEDYPDHRTLHLRKRWVGMLMRANLLPEY